MPKIALKISATVLLALLLQACAVQPAPDGTPKNMQEKTAASTVLELKEIIPGLESGQLNVPEQSSKKEFTISIISIDPSRFEFKIIENGEKAETIKEIHTRTAATLTLNGSYFDENFKPLGLLISEGKVLHDYSRSELMDGILAVGKANRPALVTGPAPDPAKYPFAIQSGPILIDSKGQISIAKDSGKVASRTVAAIGREEKTGETKIYFIFIKQTIFNSENTITLYRLAHLLKENAELQKLGIEGAINLDGGTSTGFMLMDDYFPEFEKVQHVITVKAKVQ